MTTTILGLSGSLRAGSYNTALLRAAVALNDTTLHIEPMTLHGIPLYDGDVEQRDGTPQAVRALKERILASDGLLLVSPEYNNGVPGVFKNAVDWLSRKTPGLADVFAQRAVAVIGASPGGFGTVLAQAHWLPVLRVLGARVYASGRVAVSRAGAAFDADGKLTDEAAAANLREFVHGFARFAAAHKPT
jgi:chromate reductase